MKIRFVLKKCMLTIFDHEKYAIWLQTFLTASRNYLKPKMEYNKNKNKQKIRKWLLGYKIEFQDACYHESIYKCPTGRYFNYHFAYTAKMDRVSLSNVFVRKLLLESIRTCRSLYRLRLLIDTCHRIHLSFLFPGGIS